MAEVFLAKAAGPMGFEKLLVLKRILPELAEEPSFVEMFLSEARLAARLTHPNIVQIFDFGESEGAYFLAMEYIDGPSLRTLIKRAAAQGLSLPPTVCARLISHACEGLAFAHDCTDPDTGEPLGLIHRDISPDNILLSRQGAVKVVDFGIAKAAGQSHKTESGVVKGKLPYMPPEQLRAKPLDRRADVYALGVVLYELLTGQRPYASESEAGLMQAILYEPLLPAARLRPDLPQPLRRILTKALAKEREQRYPDCHAFQTDLEGFIAWVGRPVMTQQVAQLINQATSNPELPALQPSTTQTVTPSTTETVTPPTTETVTPPTTHTLTPSTTHTLKPLPATTPLSEPPFLVRKRPSSTSTAAVTANVRAPQAPKEEEPRALVTPPPRRPEPEPMTARLRPPSTARHTPPPLEMDPRQQRPALTPSPMTPMKPRPSLETPAVQRPVMSAEKPRSSKRWVASWMAGVLMLLMGGGVVSWRCSPQPELQGPALAAESPSVREAAAPAQPSEPAGLQLPPHPEKGEPDAGSEVASASPVTPPEPDPAKPPEHSPVFKGTGTLEVRVSPFAIVFVDGKKVGLTPLKKPLELPVGPHTLEFRNDQLLSKPVIRHINVQPGPNSILKVTLQEP
jgi:serine/threonine-protein kinase